MSASVSQSRRESHSRSFLPPIRFHSSSNTNTPRRREREAELLKLLDDYDEKQQPPQHTTDTTQPLPPTHASQALDTAVVAVEAVDGSGESEDSDGDSAMPHIVSHLASHLACPYGSFQSQQAIQWLWYVIQQGEHEAAAVKAVLGAADTMPAVSEWIDVALRTAKGSVDKHKRNNLIALLAHITAQQEARAECAINGLLDTLLTHATADTATTQQQHTPHEEKQQLLPPATIESTCRWTSTNDAADMELRQLLWCVLAELSSHWLCHATIRQSQLLSTLLHYIDAASSRRHWLCPRWQPSELLQLQHYALLALVTIAPTMTELFERLDGPERLVCFIANITSDEMAEADGKRSAAQRRQLQSLAVKCVTDVFAAMYANPAHPEVERLLSSDQGESRPSSALSTDVPPSSVSWASTRPSLPITVATLLSLVADSRLSLSCRCDALNALVFLCAEQREHRHALCRQRGVELVAAMLADEATVASYVSQCPQLVSALISCVWRCVVPSNSSTATFLANGGVESLLVLITRTASHPQLQHRTLSCLADLLLQHSDSHQHFHGWSHRVHLPALLPAQPQAIALNLATTASSPLPALSALDLLLTLWPAGTAVDEAVLSTRRVLYGVLDAVGFDSFVGASAAQRGQLAWVAAFPFQCELRVWSELIDDMVASGQWDELVDEDKQRALSIRAALEDQLLAAEQYCDAMAREQLAADEQELAGYLAVLNEQRIDLTRRMLTTPLFTHGSGWPFSHSQSLATNAQHTSRSQASRASKPATTASMGTQQPSGSALLSTMQRSAMGGAHHRLHNAHHHNNSLYGRYKQVEVRVVDGSLDQVNVSVEQQATPQ